MIIEGFERYLILPDGRCQDTKTGKFLVPNIRNQNGYFTYCYTLIKEKKKYSRSIKMLLVENFFMIESEIKQVLEELCRAK